MACTRGHNPSTLRVEKVDDTSRRNRVRSGGSTASMCRANSGPGRPSATTRPPKASAACMSLENRESLSAWRASA